MIARHLYLVRHGEAKSKQEDPDRGLTQAGLADVTNVARWAQAAGIRADEIRHSGKLRARQTAEIFAEYLGSEAQAVPGLAPNDDVSAVAEAVQDEEQNIMLVGHLPFLERLAAFLTVGNAETGIVGLDAGALLELSRRGDRPIVTCLIQPAQLPKTSFAAP